MCPSRETLIDYRSSTPQEWQRARQQILGRAQAARAQALRELAGRVVRPLQAALTRALIRAFAGAVIATAREWWRGYCARCERKAAVRELWALDDRMLKDIGVNRSEIEWVVYGQDATRLKDSVIAGKCRARRATAGSTMTAAPRQAAKQRTDQHAA